MDERDVSAMRDWTGLLSASDDDDDPGLQANQRLDDLYTSLVASIDHRQIRPATVDDVMDSLSVVNMTIAARDGSSTHDVIDRIFSSAVMSAMMTMQTDQREAIPSSLLAIMLLRSANQMHVLIDGNKRLGAILAMTVLSVEQQVPIHEAMPVLVVASREASMGHPYSFLVMLAATRHAVA